MSNEQITFDEIMFELKLINQLIERIVKVVINNANSQRDTEPSKDIQIKGCE